MIEAVDLTKHYGEKCAVDHLSFRVPPGIVTGFLGPNGAGKSTTMRLILGLDRPTAGRVTVNGRSYNDFKAPLSEVGAMLEARAIHTGRSAYHHLLALAQTHGIPRKRVDEVIEVVGLSDVARKRVGAFSLGMGQRLGIAAAMLGDPSVLILDEPANGLDPEGILWIRNLLKRLAAEGRTVFLSSHLMAEIALTAERLVVIGRGRLIADRSVAEIVTQASKDAAVIVRSPQLVELADALEGPGVRIERDTDGRLEIHGIAAEQIGERAAANRIVLHELVTRQASLEEAFMRLTGGSVEFHAHDTAEDQLAEVAV